MELKTLITETLIESVEDAFSTTLSTPLEIINNFEMPAQEGIISTISLVGSVNGLVNIWLTDKVASKVVSMMLDMKVEEGSDDVLDGIGEMVNIIAGGIKNRLEGAEYDYQIGIPNTIRGNFLKTGKANGLALVKKCFKFDGETFKVTFNFKVCEDSNEPTQQKPVNNVADQLADLINKAKDSNN